MRVLHLVGSTQSDFCFDLSKKHAAALLRPAGVEYRSATLAVDGTGRVGQDPEEMTLRLWRRVSSRGGVPRASEGRGALTMAVV